MNMNKGPANHPTNISSWLLSASLVHGSGLTATVHKREHGALTAVDLWDLY